MDIKPIGEGQFLGRIEINRQPFKLSKRPTQEGKADAFDPLPNLDHILQLRLSELAKRNIAVKVYSDILGCDVWICGNATMALQVREDDSKAITYTVAEMRRIIRLNPTPEDIKNIHDAKMIFTGCKVVDSKLKDEG